MENSQGRDQSNADEGVATTAQKQSKKRVTTPARKEQNKLAQRAYRRRQKEHGRVPKQPVVPALQRLAPRPNNIEAMPVPSAVASPRRSVQLENWHVTADASRSPSKDAESPIITDLTVRDPPAISQQLSLSRLGSSMSQGEVAAVSPRPARVDSSDEIDAYPSQLSSMVAGIRRSLEDSPTCIFRACLSNAICIGIDVAELINCERFCMSPFYRPITQRNDDRAALMTVSSHESLPASLKPTPAQILIPHHASLDLVPLPRLRERAILMCAALPHVFCLWDMKLDIYTRSALVCQSHDASSGATFQPWDRRSWQAAPWFLSKWKMVVDTDEIGASLSLPGIPGLWM
ncbi:hypothetical protein F5X97DRAFT_304340 [Nemania serpens]|nr:hypothetical protein F5X97DRAFT_304340 [Nemania serpens]